MHLEVFDKFSLYDAIVILEESLVKETNALAVAFNLDEAC